MLEITHAPVEEFELIWPIFKDIVAIGDTYVYDPEISKEEAKKVWFDAKFQTFIARQNGKIAGAYVIRPNHRDLGNHIANAAFIVARDFRRQGLGRKLAEHSFTQAKSAGYKGMQFNFVVSTNEIAVNLWTSLGFEIIGTVPDAYRHQQLKKLVPIHIMYKKL